MQTYSTNSSVVPGKSFLRVVASDNIPYLSTAFVIPSDFSKRPLNISSFHNSFATSQPQLIMVIIESNFTMQDIDIIPGNVTTELDTTFIFLVDL